MKTLQVCMRNRSRVESGVKCEVRLAHCAILARNPGVASGRRSGLRSINRFSQTYALADTQPQRSMWKLNKGELLYQAMSPDIC